MGTERGAGGGGARGGGTGKGGVGGGGPPPPPPPDGARVTPTFTDAGSATVTTSTGLDPRTSAAVAYLGVVGPVLLALEGHHREVRFHAAQSSLLWLVIVAVSAGWSAIVGSLPWAGSLGRPLTVVAAAAVLRLTVHGHRLEHVELPVLGRIATRWAARGERGEVAQA
jgi:uncharacterized membrane protein